MSRFIPRQTANVLEQGQTPFTQVWYRYFRDLGVSVDALEEASSGGPSVPGSDVYNIEPTGAKNGINLTYTLPSDAEKDTFRLYRNGIRQLQDDGGAADFTLSESGGSGTGYDTVVITTTALLSWEQLTADYQVA